jgi:hypothetical protein
MDKNGHINPICPIYQDNVEKNERDLEEIGTPIFHGDLDTEIWTPIFHVPLMDDGCPRFQDFFWDSGISLGVDGLCHLGEHVVMLL